MEVQISFYSVRELQAIEVVPKAESAFCLQCHLFRAGLPSLNCPHPITTHLLHGGVKVRLQGTEKLSLGSLSKADIAFGLTGLWVVSHTLDQRPSNGDWQKAN